MRAPAADARLIGMIALTRCACREDILEGSDAAAAAAQMDDGGGEGEGEGEGGLAWAKDLMAAAQAVDAREGGVCVCVCGRERVCV